ncbi:Rad52/Rad22 family DNA repair protein [Rummeliibacillus stabekisii]|uniref:Rad52/Rad22 family DNA repair protein n=1 Tax=Rummeliibacillus stabekisii TaxID=241244 RepID=UPI00203E5316|nr:Rad52/Rad22 family DNA repair protein [Rummeliibacillus stabekisii]MCM3317945.1 Rad52/Rad22 family DNA repair protein [Rummeliibacillus stabekisii]
MELSGKEILKKLSEPFNESDIGWRVQIVKRNIKYGGFSALVCPYIQARKVMDRLDDVCNAFWKSEYDQIDINGELAFQCSLSLFIDGQWITRTDGSATSDIESVKGGYSGSLKRAAVQWGIGRYLYNLPKFWVDIKTQGELSVFGKYKVEGTFQHISGYFDRPKLNSIGTNSNQPVQTQPNNQSNQTNKQQPPKELKDQNSNDAQRLKALNFIKKELNLFKLKDSHINSLLQRAGLKTNLEAASTEDLNKVFLIVNPVVLYMKNAREMGYSNEEVLQFASKKFREPISRPENLLFKMDRPICDELLQELYNQTQNNQTA